MSKNEIIWSQCLDCKRDTRHEVLASKTIAGPIYDYRFSDEYRILQCLGCEQISFLKTFHDLEAVYPNDFDDGYSHVEEHTNYYPNASSVISKHASFLPDKLYTIYSETKVALTQKLYIFTAIGIRAIIECICNNKNISGKNLERKITNLGSLGDISRRDVVA
ncbi:MAG: hypothetical protein LKF82_01330 [Acinetobacter populi]|jgi:hypothetical protein|uniref:hypothetical protein n=1 Tax=Acinetobacter populi TaxID=1582270 RepID=UPI00235599E1|nr:hypothetical protein [Acinetobacter populi]MCH4246472.1 hypothetical protein [Acinetobacter populi]